MSELNLKYFSIATNDDPMWVIREKNGMSVIQKQEIAMLSWWDSYPFVFILEGCSK
jgi:ligand-binding sensor domain-containing protein